MHPFPAPSSSIQIRVMTVDDHPLMREGVASLISAHPELVLVAEAGDGVEAVEQFTAHRPDVVLLDLQMPRLDGIGTLVRLKEVAPAVRVLVLTTYGGDEQARRAFECGASGYLLKNAIRRELFEAIQRVHTGQRYMTREVALDLGQHAMLDRLSARELDVLRMLVRGGSNSDIGTALGLSEDTVKSHMKSILAKLQACDRTQAVVIAIRRGIVNVWN